MASNFTIPNTECKVNLTSDLTKEELLAFPAFKNWFSTLSRNLSLQASPNHEFHASPYAIRSINVQALDRFGPRIGFLKISAVVSNNEGSTLPGAVFLRGASVGMLVILQPDDLVEGSEEERYVLLTVQPRIAAGGLGFVELPAGMVDQGSFKGAAAKEIEEELGMTIPEDELINLTELAMPESHEAEKEKVQSAVYPSAGGCDEYIPLFMHVRRVPRKTLGEWEGKLTGLRDQGEKITLKLAKYGDLWREGARDAKALAAYALVEGLKKSGKL